MSDKQKIRTEVERRIKSLETNIGYGIGVDSQIDAYESLLSFIDSLPEEKLSNVERIGKDYEEWSVSEDLEEAAVEAFKKIVDSDKNNFLEIFNAGAKWQRKSLWKPTAGDDLPIFDREVIALLNNGKVVFAHRPYKGKYIGKNLTTGNIETFENKTYDEGGWNQPNVKWWLDIDLPKEK